MSRPPKVLIVVQNLPLPGDRRVWLECQALVAAGVQVSAITPAGPGDPAYQLLEGVHLYKYPPPSASSGALSFVREFAYCWLQTLRLAVRVKRERGFRVLQACNPPDTFWALALLLRPLGVRFVFDQHDLCPEVYDSRFGASGSRALRRVLLWLERRTYRTAHQVIVTNDSYREVALARGDVPEHRVTVVRTGPDGRAMRAGAPAPARRQGKAHLAAYLGVMGPQDGVDVLVRAIDHFVHVLGRKDTHFALMGSGDAWQEVRDLVTALDLDEHVSMPGRVSDEELYETLSTADVGLSPDPPGPLNDVSTMNKTMEYMAFGLPVVCFDLKETRISAGDAGVYVAGGSVPDYARAVADLLDDPEQRRERGAVGRRRVEDVLDWEHQSPAYVGVLQQALGDDPTGARPAVAARVA